MIRRPRGTTRTDPLVPYPPLFRSVPVAVPPGTEVGEPVTPGLHRPLAGLRESIPLAAEVAAGVGAVVPGGRPVGGRADPPRSEEHTSELQSLMRISYAVFCLKTKTTLDKTAKQLAT